MTITPTAISSGRAQQRAKNDQYDAGAQADHSGRGGAATVSMTLATTSLAFEPRSE